MYVMLCYVMLCYVMLCYVMLRIGRRTRNLYMFGLLAGREYATTPKLFMYPRASVTKQYNLLPVKSR